MDRPNIVLIMVDEMRGDCLGYAGHPDVKTPFLDTLASEGIYFDNAYSACPTCVPARAVLHTGMKPENTGRVGYADGIEWNYPVTLAGELSKAGYYTQCVGKMHVAPLRNNIGFHNVDLHDGYLHHYRFSDVPYSESQFVADDYMWWLKNEKGVSCDIIDTGMDCNGWTARPWMYDEMLHPTNWVTTKSIDFLRRRDKRQPFFLMMSYVRPHAPYDAPSCYFDMYKDKELVPPDFGDWDDKCALEREGRVYNNIRGPIDKEFIRQQQIGYYSCITHVDHQIGRFLQALNEHKLKDNTVIIFTSDHGDMLSDHCFSRKALPYEGSSHIPLIVCGNKRYIGKCSCTHSNVAELMDIMPTCLSLANTEIPENVDGENLLASISREYIHGEHEYGSLSNQWIVTDKDKYIWFSRTGKEQYFDLVNDKKEKYNLIDEPKYQDRIEALRKILIGELENRPEGFTDENRLICK